MRWESKFTKPEFHPGTTRLKRLFAWMPVDIDDTKVWLEGYEILQGYVMQTYNLTIDGTVKTISVNRWIDVSKRLKNK